MDLFFVTTFKLRSVVKKVVDNSSEEYQKLLKQNLYFTELKEELKALPKIKQQVWKVQNMRTPVFFDNLDMAKKFVETNDCDWQECGYYNMAIIQKMEANRCYPDSGFDYALLYSNEEGWLDVKVSEDNNLVYKGKEIDDYVGVDIG